MKGDTKRQQKNESDLKVIAKMRDYFLVVFRDEHG
jgi:hypothetical protein